MKHNWEYKRLGEVCILKVGGDKPSEISLTKAVDKSIPIYSNGIDDEGLCGYCCRPTVLESAVTISGRGTLGVPFIRREPFVPIVRLIVAIPREMVCLEYLYYWILNRKFSGNGVAIPQLTVPMIKNEAIPVPPMEVQERIVAELDKINEVIEDCRELLRNLDALAQSLFYDTFGDYYNGNCIYFKPIKEVFDTITDFVAAGSFASLRENVVYKDSPNFAQLVRTMDIKSNFTKGQFVYVDKHAFDFLWRVNLNSECIILPNIGVNCGEVYHLKPSYLRYKNNVLGPNAILIRSSCYNHKFLSFALKHDDFQKQLSKITSQVAQPKFNKTNLKELNILVPPITLQEEFAERIEAIEAIKATTQQQLAELQTLLDSRMDYWFN